MISIFLSYAHVDEARVRVIKRALRDRGHDVFWDEDIPTGENWRQVLEERVRHAQCVLVAWSSNSVKSRYVRVECELAAADHRLFPALLEKVAIPEPFDGLQAADLCDWIGNVKNPEWNRLVDRIERCPPRKISSTSDGSAFHLDSPTEAPPEKVRREPTSRCRGWAERFDVEGIVETEIRTALDLSPVETDAFRDITTIRARGDAEFAEKMRDLERKGYAVVTSKPGETLLERKKRFSWVVAAILTLVFVFPALVYIGIYFWLPKSHRVYVVQIG